MNRWFLCVCWCGRTNSWGQWLVQRNDWEWCHQARREAGFHLNVIKLHHYFCVQLALILLLHSLFSCLNSLRANVLLCTDKWMSPRVLVPVLDWLVWLLPSISVMPKAKMSCFSLTTFSDLLRLALFVAVSITQHLCAVYVSIWSIFNSVYSLVQANSEVSALLGRIPSAVGYQPTLASDLGALQERITTTKKGSITSVQAIYVPADDLTDPAPATTFAHLDATTVLSRQVWSWLFMMFLFSIFLCDAH